MSEGGYPKCKKQRYRQRCEGEDPKKAEDDRETEVERPTREEVRGQVCTKTNNEKSEKNFMV